jgi:outer membrane protein W
VNFPVGRRTFVNLDWKHFWAKTDVILKGGSKLETTTLDPDAVTIAYGIRF